MTKHIYNVITGYGVNIAVPTFFTLLFFYACFPRARPAVRFRLVVKIVSHNILVYYIILLLKRRRR